MAWSSRQPGQLGLNSALSQPLKAVEGTDVSSDLSAEQRRLSRQERLYYNISDNISHTISHKDSAGYHDT